MAKKEKNNEKKAGYSISDSVQTLDNKGKKINLENESTRFIIILLCIIAFIAMICLVDVLRNSKSDDNKNEETPASINYNEVLVGNMLEQKHDKYYVYAYNKDSKDNDTIDYLLSSTDKYYKLNLDLANNLIAVAETSNFKGTIDQIKFKGTTLLLVEKGKISKYYEGSETIIEYLRNI